MGTIAELIRDQERDAVRIAHYTRETSGLGELCFAFPSFEGKDFVQWLQAYGKTNNAHVLEFGGGVKQVAAIQTLRLVSGIKRYVGYEINEITPSAKEDLASFPQYSSVQGGLSDFDASLTGDNFSVAFAHNVAEHLPHPFLLVRKLHGLLKNGGVLFVNGIYVHEEVAEDLFKQWKGREYEFEYTFGLVDRDEEKSGIVRVNIALQKTSDTLLIPIPTGTLISDYAGNLRSNLVYEQPLRKSEKIY